MRRPIVVRTAAVIVVGSKRVARAADNDMHGQRIMHTFTICVQHNEHARMHMRLSKSTHTYSRCTCATTNVWTMTMTMI